MEVIWHEKIKQLRNELKLSQRKFAEKIMVHERTILRWEKGETIPTLENVCFMIEILQIPEGYFLPYTDKGVT